MLLTTDLEMVRDAVRGYVADNIVPHAAGWDRSSTFPADALKGLAAMGCFGIAVPEQWEGAGLNYAALAVILEEIAAGDGATSTIISVNNCPVCSILMAWGNEEQKERWLKPLASGRMLGAFCLTEPQVGLGCLGACAPRPRCRRTAAAIASMASSSSSPPARTATSPSSWLSPTAPPASAASRPSSYPPTRPATAWPAWKRSSASTLPILRRSSSRTASCRPPT